MLITLQLANIEINKQGKNLLESQHRQSKDWCENISLSGCHSLASFGLSFSKLFDLFTFLPEQNGHPLPLSLFSMAASHTWSLSKGHCHQIFFPEPRVKSSGFKSLFFVGCHSLFSLKFLIRAFSLLIVYFDIQIIILKFLMKYINQVYDGFYIRFLLNPLLLVTV